MCGGDPVNTTNNKAYAHDVDFVTTENGASATFSTKRGYFPALIGDGSAPAALAPSTKTIFEILRGDNTPNDDFLESNGTAENPKMESNGPDEIKVDGTKFQRKIKDELDGTADVEQTKTLIAAVPRMCGGDPKSVSIWRELRGCSPHVRG